MSYICADHGWRHQCNPCPYCQGASQPRPSIGGLVGVNSDHYQKLDAENKVLKSEAALYRQTISMANETIKSLEVENRELKEKLGKANKLIKQFDPHECFVFEDGSEDLEQEVVDYLKELGDE